MRKQVHLPAKTAGSRSARLIAALYDRGQTTFTLSDAQELTGLTAISVRTLLWKAMHRGLVSRVKAGLFTLVPSELGSEWEYAGNPYLVARALVGSAPYYLSHSTAMELHRMVTQPRLGVMVSTSKRITNRVLHSTDYKFISVKPEEIFGTQPHWVTKQDQVIVSDIERTVVDGLRRPEYCGGIAEVAKGLWMRHEGIKTQKLIQYATRLKVGAVNRRLGYLLELYRLGTSADLNRLRDGLTRTYDVLDPVLGKGGPYIARWRLQLNVSADELESIRRT
jgi:predicted transcriptional regulator of viral defense system